MNPQSPERYSSLRAVIQTRSKRLVVSAALSLFFISASAAFADCNHPGTANPVTIKVTSPSSLIISITNTAKEGDHIDIWFEVEDKAGHAHRTNYQHIPYGRVVFDTWTGLQPNQTSCYHVWTRDDNLQGCRSENPGAWVCATTPPAPAPPVPPQNTGSNQNNSNGNNGPVGITTDNGPKTPPHELPK